MSFSINESCIKLSGAIRPLVFLSGCALTSLANVAMYRGRKYAWLASTWFNLPSISTIFSMNRNEVPRDNSTHKLKQAERIISLGMSGISLLFWCYVADQIAATTLEMCDPYTAALMKELVEFADPYEVDRNLLL